jgi:hypothetical protein
MLISSQAADIIKADNLGLIPQGCGANSGFAGQGSVIANHSILSSSTSSLTSAPSTFSEFLNSSVLSVLNIPPPAVSVASLSLASGALPSQLSPASKSGVNADAIQSAAIVFQDGAGLFTVPPILGAGFLSTSPATFTSLRNHTLSKSSALVNAPSSPEPAMSTAHATASGIAPTTTHDLLSSVSLAHRQMILQQLPTTFRTNYTPRTRHHANRSL